MHDIAVKKNKYCTVTTSNDTVSTYDIKMH